jgi:hypothetical protein
MSQEVFSQKERVQAGYIYNFTNYINWPEASRTGDFIIKVIGSDPIVNELKNLAAAKKIVNQSIIVQSIESGSDAGKCHILVIPSGKSGQLKAAVGVIGNYPTLIITDSPGAATNGSGINFVIKDGKMVFEMNPKAIEKQGLQVNSKLSQLAILIR